MANTITNTTTGKINVGFVDGDTRVITIPNLKSDVTEAEITTLNQQMRTSNVIIGDKAGGAFARINTVTRERKQTIKVDI